MVTRAEAPSSELKFKNGVLQQKWRISVYDQHGNVEVRTEEWRDVPREDDNGNDIMATESN